MFTKLVEAAISFVMSVHLYFCMEKLSPCLADCHEILYWEVLLTSAHIIKVWLKFDRRHMVVQVSLEFFIDIILLATLWPWGQLSL
jgi:hypothetical protein